MNEKNYGWFCTALFTHIHTNIDNEWSPCCRSTKDENFPVKILENTTPLEYFNSDEMNLYRDLTLAGKAPSICQRCRYEEDLGVQSYRQLSNKYSDIEKAYKIADHYKQTGQIKFDERVLDIKVKIFGNYCNLKCFMCHPQNSSSRQTELKKIEKKYDFDIMSFALPEKDRSVSFEKTVHFSDVIEELIKLAPYTLRLKILGGEPFIMDSHYDLLDRYIEIGEAKNISLYYVTNLTKFKRKNKDFLEYIDYFKDILVTASMDGLYEQAEWVRYGLNWNEFIENLETIRSYDNVSFNMNFTASMLSVFQVTDFYDFFILEHGIKPHVDDNIVFSPNFLNMKHLPNDIKERLIANIQSHAYPNAFKGIVSVLKEERDEEAFQLAMTYIKILNDFRMTNVGKLFPELESYINNADVSLNDEVERIMHKVGKPVYG